jgi:hypothetical protein
MLLYSTRFWLLSLTLQPQIIIVSSEKFNGLLHVLLYDQGLIRQNHQRPGKLQLDHHILAQKHDGRGWLRYDRLLHL